LVVINKLSLTKDGLYGILERFRVDLTERVLPIKISQLIHQVVQLSLAEQISCIRERGHPGTVLQLGIPTDMVNMEVSA
tara:strand:- start:1 stop:237 length:237 start_codon:yes stop_codon:yes gene_type:complete